MGFLDRLSGDHRSICLCCYKSLDSNSTCLASLVGLFFGTLLAVACWLIFVEKVRFFRMYFSAVVLDSLFFSKNLLDGYGRRALIRVPLVGMGCRAVYTTV